MKPLTTGKIKTIYDEEFENIYIEPTIEEFNQLGFSFGDSLNFKLDNGIYIEDIPYYSGYYAGVEELQFCGYPGDPHVKIARNCGNPTWPEFNIKEGTMIEVSLNEKAKYIDVQELFSLKYSDERDDYDSDEMFTNFRELVGGSMKAHYFFRGCSPCDNIHNRAAYADKLVEKHSIQCVLNLSNSVSRYEAFLEKDDFNSPYYHNLYQNGNVLLLLLNVNYHSVDFRKKLGIGLLRMLEHKGPVLVHCMEGKDRTGFVCAVLLSLAGATPQDIITDYMKTYLNYYHITKEKAPKKYEAILDNVHDFITTIGENQKGVPLHELDLRKGVIDYLKKGDLTDTQINQLIEYVTEGYKAHSS
ncbi:MAG: tyrosine-protein phosphatase [Solobacterium sp.]|nr:tyrosine-protein phosphatase [Solobacterium sp.]